MVRLSSPIVLSICSISASRLWMCPSLFCSRSSSFCVSAFAMLVEHFTHLSVGFCLKPLSYLFEMRLLPLLTHLLVLAARLGFSMLYFCLAFLEISFPTCCLSFHLLNSLLNNCFAHLYRSFRLTNALQSLSCPLLEMSCLVLSASHFLFLPLDCGLPQKDFGLPCLGFGLPHQGFCLEFFGFGFFTRNLNFLLLRGRLANLDKSLSLLQ